MQQTSVFAATRAPSQVALAVRSSSASTLVKASRWPCKTPKDRTRVVHLSGRMTTVRSFGRRHTTTVPAKHKKISFTPRFSLSLRRKQKQKCFPRFTLTLDVRAKPRFVTFTLDVRALNTAARLSLTIFSKANPKIHAANDNTGSRDSCRCFVVRPCPFVEAWEGHGPRSTLSVKVLLGGEGAVSGQRPRFFSQEAKEKEDRVKETEVGSRRKP